MQHSRREYVEIALASEFQGQLRRIGRGLDRSKRGSGHVGGTRCLIRCGVPRACRAASPVRASQSSLYESYDPAGTGGYARWTCDDLLTRQSTDLYTRCRVTRSLVVTFPTYYAHRAGAGKQVTGPCALPGRKSRPHDISSTPDAHHSCLQLIGHPAPTSTIASLRQAPFMDRCFC